MGDMLGYALRRVAWTLPILLLTLTLVFFVLREIAHAALDPRVREGLGPRPAPVGRNQARARPTGQATPVPPRPQ
jgi:hypothetical protein